MSHVIITIEAAFDCKDAVAIPAVIAEALESLRGQGAARVIASRTQPTDPFEDKEWREKAITSILIDAPVEIEVD